MFGPRRKTVKKKGLYRLALEWYLKKLKVPFNDGMLDAQEGRKEESLPHFRISEYQRLKFMWEELGLNVKDLEDMDAVVPGWTSDMLVVGSAHAKATEMHMNDARSKTNSQAPQGPGGARVIKRKLL